MRLPLIVATVLALLATPASAALPLAWTLRVALVDICRAQGAKLEDPAFVRRMADTYGFVASGDEFRREGPDGLLVVNVIYEGCVFRMEAPGASVADADNLLQAFAREQRLTSEMSDQSDTGDGGRRISRERFTAGRGRLNWQVFEGDQGADRPSRLEGVWNRHPH